MIWIYRRMKNYSIWIHAAEWIKTATAHLDVVVNTGSKSSLTLSSLPVHINDKYNWCDSAFFSIYVCKGVVIFTGIRSTSVNKSVEGCGWRKWGDATTEIDLPHIPPAILGNLWNRVAECYTFRVFFIIWLLIACWSSFEISISGWSLSQLRCSVGMVKVILENLGGGIGIQWHVFRQNIFRHLTHELSNSVCFNREVGT